jgi:tetratricopeptide (TPR) repeat protein
MYGETPLEQEWLLHARLEPHVLALHDASPDDASMFADWPQLLVRAGQDRYEPLLRDALAIYEKVLGPEDPKTAATLNHLARLRRHLGDTAGARPLIERALAIYEKVLGPEDPETAFTLDYLGQVFEKQGDIAGARLLWERELAILEKVYGYNHPTTTVRFYGLRNVLWIAWLEDPSRPPRPRRHCGDTTALRTRSCMVREVPPSHTDGRQSG